MGSGVLVGGTDVGVATSTLAGSSLDEVRRSGPSSEFLSTSTRTRAAARTSATPDTTQTTSFDARPLGADRAADAAVISLSRSLSNSPQWRHFTASALIVSAQNGH